MKNFFQSFYFKLSFVFLFILILMAAIQIYITLHYSTKFTKEVDQQLNLNLARDMAFELGPFLQDEELDFNKIGERIHYMMVMNPKIEIYVLNDTGKIMAFFAEPGKDVEKESVDLEPIKLYLANSENLPILGDNPRNPGVRKPFSASKLQYGQNRGGYLYIVIGSEQYDYAMALFRENLILNTILRGLLVTIFFVGILGLILFAFLTKRIRTMSETVKSFENGEYHQRIQTKSNDEVGQLGHSFNQMANTIVSNMDELKQTDELRRELIANVSHDLRSPLASIQGYLETILMKEKSLSAEERKNYLTTILRSTKMLNKMVHELFDLSKLDAKQTVPNYEEFSLAELAQDVVMKYKDKAEKLNIILNPQIDHKLPSISADIALIDRVLSNLIENALHYTPENGSIEVEVKKEKSAIRTSIADTGCGIPENELAFIFERYFRGKKSGSRTSGSTGLGLPIAKKILELHESTIEVESKEGVGTKFIFDIKTI
jgi:signal transduction histidine kinase